MSLLTTLLLADAVEKGGPGSGPHPSGMGAAAINHELDRLDAKSKDMTQKLIQAGWGSLRPTEFPADHPLTSAYHAIEDRRGALHNEIRNRQGPSAGSRLNRGVGPIGRKRK